MRGKNQNEAGANRAAIYARVSDRSQAEEDKTSLTEQTAAMESYCERHELVVVARYKEVGPGWSKQRPEFQRMLADARQGRFDTIVCWKSDRLSRGLFPTAVLMEVVEAYPVRLESVMDAIDIKLFALMAVIAKMELDNLASDRRWASAERPSRGAFRQGHFPMETAWVRMEGPRWRIRRRPWCSESSASTSTRGGG